MLRMDFTSQEYLQNPAAGLAKLRAAGPVVAVRFPIVGKTWITTNADLAARVLKDNETFTMRKDGKVAGLRWWMPGSIRSLAVSMLSVDEPDHTRLRGIVDEAFRRRAVLDMEPRVFAIADELAAELFFLTELRLTWSSAMRGGCHSRSFASYSASRPLTGLASSPGRIASLA